MQDSIEISRHSLAHILSKAVCELYPGTKLATGPAKDYGFFYDFDIPVNLTPEDFSKIEEKMKEILKRQEDFVCRQVSREEAKAEFADEPYKLELIDELPEGEIITIYDTGADYKDLCAGPHVANSKELLSWTYKIDTVSAVYWRGDASRQSLQRIKVFAFPSKAEMKEHLRLLEEAKKRDHRVLGPQLDLFFLDESAPGMPYWLPKGWKLFNTILDFWRDEHESRGYQEISSPLINANDLWVTSGHWDHYKDNMFVIPVSEEEVYGVKPMNCPNSILVYKRKTRSYRDLPLRLSDCDVLHRKEKSGQLHGLLRVQMFRQDDSHNFITEEQIYDEINAILDIADRFYSIFGLEYRPELSTRPADFMGDIALWDQAEAALKEILDKRYGAEGYDINEGDGAFYGPKIDIMMKDALKRQWQMGTIQLDFQLPRNFDITYTDKDGERKTPVMVHRVIYGSLERFIDLLIEHTAGKFPFWASPVQVGIVPVREHHNEYATEVDKLLKSKKIRTEVDYEDRPMGGKVSTFRKELLPYVVIVGDKEVENKTVSIRIRTGVQINDIPVDVFVNACALMNEQRTLELQETF